MAPDALGQELQQVQDRLSEVLERGLREVLADTQALPQDEQIIIAVLTSQPTPEQVLALRPSPAFQERASSLLAKSKAGAATAEERIELERYLVLEHFVRMAKANALQQRAQA